MNGMCSYTLSYSPQYPYMCIAELAVKLQSHIIPYHITVDYSAADISLSISKKILGLNVTIISAI